MEFPMHMPGAFQTPFQSPPDSSIVSSYFSVQPSTPLSFPSDVRRPSYPRSQNRSHSGSHVNTFSGSRKRARIHDTDAETRPSPHLTSVDDCARFFVVNDCPSPAPLVSIDYKLAGGLDNEGIRLQQKEEDDTRFDYEQDYRPSRYHRAFSVPAQSDGVRHEHIKNQHQPGWGSAVWAVTGGVAGKVFNFCVKTAFRGFYAGSGQGYQLRANLPEVVSPTWSVDSRGPGMFDSSHDCTPSITVTSVFPTQSVCAGDYFSTTSPGSGVRDPVRPRSKATTPTLRRGWVVVNSANHDGSDYSPVRKKSRASIAGFQSREHIAAEAKPCRPKFHRSRSSIGSSGRASVTEASYASPRSRKRDSEHISSERTPRHRSTLTARASMPVMSLSEQHGEPHVSSVVEAQALHVTPKKPDDNLSKLSDKMRKRERQQDANIQRFNRQLRDMIREGQQALASKVEVEMEAYGDDVDDDNEDMTNDDVDDEGYEEGEFDDEMGNSKLSIGGINISSTAHTRSRIGVDGEWRSRDAY